MPSEPTSPTTPKKPELKRQKFEHVDTPTKASIQGTVSFLEAQSIPYSKPDVFEHFGVPQATGYRILRDDSSRTWHNTHSETRGRKPILNEDETLQISQMFEEGIEKGEGDAQ
jgi:hypothetical protein